MKSFSTLAKKHESGLLVAVALLLVGTLFTIERFDLLPLQGAAVPMYGSLPSPALHRAARSSVARKPSLTAQRKLRRMSQSSSHVSRASSSSARTR